MDQFNSDFAAHWDELIDWDKRTKSDSAFLINLLNKMNCRKVLDLALGTGFDSIQLLKRGFEVTSVDISPAMIDVAIVNAKKNSVELSTYCADWANLNEIVTEQFDCLICLGNSFACEMDTEKRRRAFKSWSNALSSDGVIIIDRRNYESLLSGTYVTARNACYLSETVEIEHAKIKKDSTLFYYKFADQRKFSLSMYPILESELLTLAMENNLNLVESYGDKVLFHSSSDVSFYLYIFRKNHEKL